VSWVRDLLASVRKVVLLEDRVERLTRAVEAQSRDLAETRERLIRLEGLLEGAFRASGYARTPAARELPPPA
jgi:hypothetical protein